MITFAILILIVAKALPGLNTHISSIHVTRITSIVFLFAGALSLNSLNLENIGSGIGIYSGFFQVTTISQLIEIFLFIIGGGILIAWPQGAIKELHNLSFPPVAALPFYSYQPFWGDKIKNKKRVPSLPLGREAGDSYYYNNNRVLRTNGSSPCQQHSPAFRQSYGGGDYSLVVLFSSLGSSLLISSYDLISVYLSIELQSFGLYVLSTLYRDSESSTSAGLKYFLLGGLSSCIILLGTGIIYSYTGTTNLESLYIINSVSPGGGITRLYIIQGINLGLSLIFIGFLFKIAAAPLHNWSPDVYDGTPTIVTTWLTIIPKIAILFILLELQIKLGSFGLLGGGATLKTIIINNSGYLLNFTLAQATKTEAINEFLNLNLTSLAHPPLWEQQQDLACAVPPLSFRQGGGDNILKTLLLISATLSLIIGSLLGLAQIRIKRLLAYSTISHIGFILLALAVNTEQSIDSFIFYIIQYTITNLNIFLVILGLTYSLSNYTDLRASDTSSSFSPSLGHPSFSPLPLGRGNLPLAEGEPYGESSYLEGTANYSTRFRPLPLGPALAGESCGGANKDINFISEFKGLFFSNPLLSISLAVSLFSMAGIPPLIGFFSKQLVLYSALQNGYYFISVLAIIVSVISCSYYLKLIKILFTAPSLKESPPLREAESRSPSEAAPAFGALARSNRERSYIINLTNTHSYLISTLTFTILFFFIKPSLILNSTQLLSLSLFYI